MKAIVDQDTCIGCGLCTSLCDGVFEMNEEGKSFSIVEIVPSDIEDAARDAETSCPVGAITLE